MPNSQPEWKLQTAIKSFVARYVAVEHEFAAHDRSRNHGGKQHLWEAARGVRAGWPDCELVVSGGVTFRCELKAPGNKPDERQEKLLARLKCLGHPTAWVDSVFGYYLAASAAGIPFRGLAREMAMDYDLKLQARAAAPKKRASRKRAPRPDAAKLRRVAAIRSRCMF